MSRLVVHIGAAKTATTYVQHSLYDNRVALADSGVYMPEAGRFDFSSKTVLHHNLAWEYLDPERFDVGAGGWDAVVAEVAQSDADVILLTSESLERMTQSAPQRQMLEKQLRRISDDVTVVYVVRDQLSYLNSLYNQNIKSFRLVETFESYVNRILKTDQLNLDKRFKDWYSSDILDFVAIPFETLTTGNVLQNFLQAARIDVPEARLTEPRSISNESLGPIGVEAARLLGSYLRILDPAFDYRSHAALKTYRMAARKARENGWCSDSFWGWDETLAREVAKREQESNLRFASSVWGPEGRLDLPVDRPQRMVRLIDQSAEDTALVHRFAGAMSRRYMHLRGGQGPQKGRRHEPESDDAADLNEMSAYE